MRRAYRHLVTQTVIVNLKTDKAFRGILWQERRDLLVLRDAELAEHGDTTSVDGEVLIDRDNIDFVQVIG